MNLYEKIWMLINDKYEHFVEFEKVTSNILSCDIDDIENLIKKRESLINLITKIDSEITKLCSECDYPEIALKAVKCLCNRNEIPQELKKVFDATMNVFSVVNRINDLDNQARQRIDQEKTILLIKIKENNKSAGAQASKYLPSNNFDQTSMILNQKF